MRISALSDTFCGWSETGPDGSFEIYLPEGSSGPAVLSVLGGLADCGWVGYYSADGITSRRDETTGSMVGPLPPRLRNVPAWNQLWSCPRCPALPALRPKSSYRKPANERNSHHRDRLSA